MQYKIEKDVAMPDFHHRRGLGNLQKIAIKMASGDSVLLPERQARNLHNRIKQMGGISKTRQEGNKRRVWMVKEVDIQDFPNLCFSK